MFQLDNTTPTATNGSAFLAGNAIHKVKFVEASKEEVGAQKSPVVKIKFEAIDGSGSHEAAIFAPTSDERKTGGPNNYESPSENEEFQTKLRQYIAAINPDLDKAINDGTKKIGAKDWEGMRDVIVAALHGKGNKNVGREMELKLLKNNKGYAMVPGYVAGLAKPKDGEKSKVYHRTKFIGEGLSFTDQEMNAINKAAGAKPTNMPADEVSTGLGGGSEDLDFDLEDL